VQDKLVHCFLTQLKMELVSAAASVSEVLGVAAASISEVISSTGAAASLGGASGLVGLGGILACGGAVAGLACRKRRRTEISLSDIENATSVTTSLVVNKRRRTEHGSEASVMETLDTNALWSRTSDLENFVKPKTYWEDEADQMLNGEADSGSMYLKEEADEMMNDADENFFYARDEIDHNFNEGKLVYTKKEPVQEKKTAKKTRRNSTKTGSPSPKVKKEKPSAPENWGDDVDQAMLAKSAVLLTMLNQADEEMLCGMIQSITAKNAKQIVNYRAQNGKFTSLSQVDVASEKGLAEKILQAN